MADERVTLRGLAGEYRMCHTGGLVTKLEALADSGHFIGRRMRPEEVVEGERCIVAIKETGEEWASIATKLPNGWWQGGFQLDEADITYAIPLADLAPEGE